MISVNIQKIKTIISGDLDFKELLKGSALTFGFKIIGLICGFFTTFVTVKIYGAAALGIVAIIFSVIHFGNILSKFGIDTATLRFIAAKGEDKAAVKQIYQKSLKLITLFSLLISFILFISADLIAADILNKPYLALYLKWSAPAVPLLSFMFLNKESLRAIKNISSFAFLNTTSINLFSLILLLVLQFYSRAIYIPVVALIAAIFISGLLSFLIWNKNKFKNETIHNDSTSYASLLSTGSSLFIGGLALFFSNWIAIFILGIYATEAETGIYETAFKIAAITSLAIMAVNGISAPKFAEAFGAENIQKLQKQVKQSTKLIFFFTIPVALLLFLFPEFFLQLFDPSFVVAAFSLRILIIGFLINAMAGSVGVLLQMAGQQKLFMYITVTAGILNLLLCLLLIPVHGINGAAAAGTISLIIWNILAVIFVYRKLNIISFFKPF